MSQVIIDIYSEEGFNFSVALETDRPLTENQISNAHSTLKKVFIALFDPNEPLPSFHAFHQELRKLDSELADQLSFLRA